MGSETPQPRHVSTWLQAALVPRKWDVCGVLCPALSVWHQFVLTEMGSAYFRDTLTDRDAATELLVYCSGDYRHGRRLFSDPRYRGAVTRRVARAVKRHREWPEVDAAVLEYLETCLRTPGHKTPVATMDSGPSKALAAPLGFVLVDYFSRGNAHAVEAAWNLPFSLAKSLFDAGRDVRGEDETLESREDEVRFDAFVARQQQQGGK